MADLTEVKKQPDTTRRMLAASAVGPLIFIITFLIEGALRAGYNPLRQPVSSLSIGETGWTQIANFIISGCLIAIGAAGLRRSGSTWGPILIGLAGIGLIGAGFFVTDPLNGYPPGSPLVPAVRSTSGKLHDLFGTPVFLGLPIGGFVFGRHFARRRDGRWAVASILSGTSMLVFFVLASMGFAQQPGFSEIAGVFQRLSIASGLLWITALAVHVMRSPAADTSRSASS